MYALANDEAMNAVESAQHGSETHGGFHALINKSDSHCYHNDQAGDHFHTAMIEVGCFTRCVNRNIRQLAAVKLNEPTPLHLAIASCQPKQEICGEVLNLAENSKS